MNRIRAYFFSLLAFLLVVGPAFSQAPPPPPAPEAEVKPTPKGLDERIDDLVAGPAKAISDVIFVTVPVEMGVDAKGEKKQPFFVIFWLAGGALFLTLWFKFINITGFGVAIRTIRMKYSKPTDPGEITHFQALAAALSGTVGLGNIAGVAIGISTGGPGAAFWMFIAGLLGMTTKFCECTLGVRYREIVDGKVYGGSFYTLKKGLAEIGLGPLGKVMAVFFAICCVGGAFGGGNMFQVNQAYTQFIGLMGPESFWIGKGWLFGLIIAVLTGLTIIGGIKSIAKVTDKLTPFMCGLYVLSTLYILILHAGKIPHAIGVIMENAFTAQAGLGGALAAMIWGFRRAAFSNEAGFGSSPIAHSAVKTRYPASEGYVALLEPFMDTVIVCSMTALVLVVTGSYTDGTKDGIAMTSAAFATGGEKVMPIILFLSVLCFAISTLISWSYYGEQAWAFLFGRSKRVEIVYKLIFCVFIVLGCGAKIGAVVDFSDAMMFAMCFPNFIGIYLLLPKIKEEIAKYKAFREKVDAAGSVEAVQD